MAAAALEPEAEATFLLHDERKACPSADTKPWRTLLPQLLADRVSAQGAEPLSDTDTIVNSILRSALRGDDFSSDVFQNSDSGRIHPESKVNEVCRYALRLAVNDMRAVIVREGGITFPHAQVPAAANPYLKALKAHYESSKTGKLPTLETMRDARFMPLLMGLRGIHDRFHNETKRQPLLAAMLQAKKQLETVAVSVEGSHLPR
jgi:hypothetical protein